MPHLLRSGVEAHVFTREEQSRGGRAKAAKYAAEVKEKRRRRRRARYLAEKWARDNVWRRTRVRSRRRAGKGACPGSPGADDLLAMRSAARVGEHGSLPMRVVHVSYRF